MMDPGMQSSHVLQGGCVMRIEGRVAIVTGAGAAGTGRAVAESLARRGASVVVSDIDVIGGEETVGRIKALGARAEFVRADVRVRDDIRGIAAFAEQSFGGLDILVNNAGNTWAPHFPDCPPEHWEAALDLNLRGPMFAIQVALGAMRRQGGGAIVNVSSVAGLGYGVHDSPEYAAAKAGLIRLTATLAPLAETDNVRVNCVVPHWIETDEVKRQIAAMNPEEQANVPRLLQRLGVADAVVGLVEDEAMAGRVLVMWCEEPSHLIDPGRRE
jgi:NAD(P)-dependent dehydrogenase (short-subunit alcohol dehydrogenase family)